MTDIPAPHPIAPPPRRGWLRRLLVTAGAVFFAVCLLVYVAPRVVAGTSLKDRVIASATADLNGTVEVGEMSLGWFAPVEMRRVVVRDKGGATAVEVGTVTVSRTLFGLARSHTDLGTVTLTDAVVHLRCEPGSTNLERVLEKYLAPGGPEKAERTAVVVKCVNATVRLTEAGSAAEQVIGLPSLDATLPRAKSEPIAVKLTATTPDAAAPGNLTADASYGPKSTLALTADRFALDALGPLVRRFQPGTTLAGRLDAAASGEFATGPNPFEGRLKGTATVTGLDCGGPWARGDKVHFAQIKFSAHEVVATARDVKLNAVAIDCDAGTLRATSGFSLTEPVEKLFTQPGLSLAVNVDLAKLAAIAPRLLRLHEGTSLAEGRVTADIASTPSALGVGWTGSLKVSSIRGQRNGKPLAWEDPLALAFRGHLRQSDNLPEFEDLKCAADFVGLAARGSAESCLVAANVDLDRLTVRLRDFVDLGGIAFGGSGRLDISNDPRPNLAGGFHAKAKADLKDFTFTDWDGKTLREKHLVLVADLTGIALPKKPLTLDKADISVVAGSDELTLQLLEPVTYLVKTRTGKVRVGLKGELTHWRERLANWVALPPDWTVAGNGPVNAVVVVRENEIELQGVNADLANARFAGAGVTLDEPRLRLTTAGVYDRKSRRVTLSKTDLNCDTLVFATNKLELTPGPDGYALSTKADVTANLNRLQRALSGPTPPNRPASESGAVNGLAVGDITLNSAGGATGFSGKFVVTKFVYGPAAKPTWSEARLTVAADGKYGDDALKLAKLEIGNDGLKADAKGSLTKLSTLQTLDIGGDLSYDLARIDGQLHDYLGAGGRVSGTGKRPFHVSGDLGGDSPGGTLVRLSGDAGVSWQLVHAYGFDVGPGETKATLGRGVLALTPIEAKFGGVGTVRAEPSFDFTKPATELSLKPGEIIKNAKLTPAACASAVGYALPAFANAAKADGRVSFTVAENAVPIADPGRGLVKGTLTVHEANVSPGPVITDVLTELGVAQTSLQLPKEQVVPVRLENGRVYHEHFEMKVGQTLMSTSGSVGLDQTLNIVLDMPVPPKLLTAALANNPRIRDALSKQRIKIPIGGTLQKPAFDRAATNANLQALLSGAAKDAAGATAKDYEKRLEDKLRDELQRKLGGGKQ